MTTCVQNLQSASSLFCDVGAYYVAKVVHLIHHPPTCCTSSSCNCDLSLSLGICCSARVALPPSEARSRVCACFCHVLPSSALSCLLLPCPAFLCAVLPSDFGRSYTADVWAMQGSTGRPFWCRVPRPHQDVNRWSQAQDRAEVPAASSWGHACQTSLNLAAH